MTKYLFTQILRGITLLTLMFSITGVTSASAAPLTRYLNADGTLNLSSGYNGGIDISNYNVSIDPQRGPIFRQQMAPSVWNPLGTTPIISGIRTMAISGTNVYIGGGFTNVAGIANADYIAKWNGSAWSALGATPLTYWVSSIAVDGTDVYVGGYFTDAGGNPNADHIAKWNGTSWSALGTGLSTSSYDIVISGANVYVGGNFTDAGGNPNADYIAKWNGSSWSALGPTPFNGTVADMVVSGTDLYAVGSFSNAGGIANADYVAKWNGSTWSALGTSLGTANSIWSIALNGTDVYLGGSFTDAAGVANADNIVKWDGSTWSALDTGFNNTVYAVGIISSNIYAAGDFTNASANPNADYVAKFGPPPAPVTVTIRSNAAQDGWVLESNETSGIGGAVYSTGPALSLGDNAARQQYRSIISFNTSTLPDAAVITGVTLKLKQKSFVGGTNQISLFQGVMIDIKTGFFGTVSTVQPPDFQATADKTLGPASPTLNSNFYTISLINGKNYINKLATNNGLTQIRLRFALDDNNDSVANYLALYSGEATAAADRPQLTITYTLP